MGDGILLAPYPVVNYNPFAAAPQGQVPQVVFQSSHVTTPTANVVSPSLTASTTSAAPTSTTVEDKAPLELKTQKLKDRYKDKEEQKAIAAEEVDFIKHGQTCLLALGAIFTFLALAAAVVAFGTPEWRVYDVNEQKVKLFIDTHPNLNICTNNTRETTCQFFTSRVRGLFVTCYSDGIILPKAYPNALTSPWVNGWNCVWEQKYNLQTTPITVEANCANDPSQKNGQAMVDTNTNIMRTQWLAFASAIICLAMGFIFTLVSCRKFRVGGSMCSGIFLLFAAILLLIGMVLFHVYTYMEEETLRCPPFYAIMKKDTFSGVYSNTSVSFGFSFYLGWSSFAMAILSCAFVLAVGCIRQRAQVQIDKAMYRLTQINKEERAEKKFEEMEAKKRRKELEKQMKMEAKLTTPQAPKLTTPFNKGGILALFSNMKRRRTRRVSDSEIDLEINSLKKEKQERLRRLRNEAEDEIELESSKIKARKDKQLKELKKAQQDLEEMEERIRILERSKKQKKKSKKVDDSSSDSDNDAESTVRKNQRQKKRPRSVDSFDSSTGANWFRIDRKCGRVVGPTEFRQQSCCDPYTLHLPTGFNPPPYYP